MDCCAGAFGGTPGGIHAFDEFLMFQLFALGGLPGPPWVEFPLDSLVLLIRGWDVLLRWGFRPPPQGDPPGEGGYILRVDGLWPHF